MRPRHRERTVCKQVHGELATKDIEIQRLCLQDHKLVHDDAKGKRGQAEIQAAQSQRGQRNEATHQRTHAHCQQHGTHRQRLLRGQTSGSNIELPCGDDGHTGEREHSKVDLAGVTGEQHQRQCHQRQRDAVGQADDCRARHDGLQHRHGCHQHAAPQHGFAHGWHPEPLACSRDNGAAQAVLWQQQQRAEQQQCGDGITQVAQHKPALTRIGDPVEVELREAQHHGAHIGERHAAQATRYGCRIGIKHKQREREHL